MTSTPPLSPERLQDAQKYLALTGAAFASALRITPEWLSRIYNGKGKISEDLALRLDALLRLRGVDLSSIPQADLGSTAGESGQAAWQTEGKKRGWVEPPLAMGSDARSVGGRMQLTPAFAAAEPTREQVLDYLRRYLDGNAGTPGVLGHTWVELQRKFPLPEFEPQKKTP